MEQAEFEPVILAFCCNWCSYAGADLAGTSRFEYPTNVRIIRVMCSGRIDPTFVLEAFKDGADGVLVTGCHPGDCHYVQGNYMMERRFAFIKEALRHLGIEPERLRLEWISAGEGEKFAALIRDTTQRIKELGPNPLTKTDAAIEAFKAQRLRWIIGIQQAGLKVDEQRYKAVSLKIMKDEIERQMIIVEIKEKGPQTIKELAEATKISPKEVLRHIIALKKIGVVSEAGEKEDAYLYKVS